MKSWPEEAGNIVNGKEYDALARTKCIKMLYIARELQDCIFNLLNLLNFESYAIRIHNVTSEYPIHGLLGLAPLYPRKVLLLFRARLKSNVGRPYYVEDYSLSARSIWQESRRGLWQFSNALSQNFYSPRGG